MASYKTPLAFWATDLVGSTVQPPAYLSRAMSRTRYPLESIHALSTSKLIETVATAEPSSLSWLIWMYW